MYENENAGADVARALGFNPKEFLEINLRFRAGDLLVVTTEQLVTRDQLKRVTDEIVKRRFFVSEIEDENPAPVAPAPAADGTDWPTSGAGATQPDVGEGWRLLGREEILQAGDEADVGHDEPQWVPTSCVGQRVGDIGDGYRRRVTPELADIAADTPLSATSGTLPDAEPDVGEGWRLLDVGETVRDGDHRYQDQEWVPCCISVGRKITERIAYGICYRRRVTPESKHVVVPAASTPLEAMPLPASQVTHGNGYRQNNPDAGDAWRDVRSE